MAPKPRVPRVRASGKALSLVTRREFKQVVNTLSRRASIIDEHAAMLTQIHRDLDIQFKRIAQMQQELEELKKTARKSA
jgi:hypothetical protein